jgi:hypothetical protein
MISSETDVRRIMTATYGDRVFWIEHARGGTEGMPDCLVARPDGGGSMYLQPMELKAASLVEGWWNIFKKPGAVRPSQFANARRMLACGVEVLFLVGEIGAETVFFATGSEVLRAGDDGGRLFLCRKMLGLVS